MTTSAAEHLRLLHVISMWRQTRTSHTWKMRESYSASLLFRSSGSTQSTDDQEDPTMPKVNVKNNSCNVLHVNEY